MILLTNLLAAALHKLKSLRVASSNVIKNKQ